MIESVEKNIKQIRELKNFSQEYISSQLGLSIRAYSKIESGETQLTINRLNQISQILEVPPMEILGFDEKQVFNHCKQEGNIGINHINLPVELKEQYENQIQQLKEEVLFLRNQLQSKN